MSRRFTALAAILLAGTAGAGWWWMTRTPAPVEWQGYAEADFVKIGPTQQGLLTSLYVARGSRVAAGAPLFDQDDTADVARRHGATFRSEPRHRAELARTRVGDTELWLLKPMSYMNHSGDPVRSVASFYKIPIESVLVAYDELDFPAGVVRLKQGGGAAGHNGMRDVIAQMGDAFWRLRIGIGHPGDRAAVLDYVLGRPRAAEAQLIHEALLAAADIVPLLLTEGAQIAMNRLHSRESVPGAPRAPANS